MTTPVSHLDILTRLFSLNGLRLLDIGCGDGALARALRRHGATVWGVDPNPAQVEAFNADLPPEEGQAVQAGGASLPFEAGAFEGVLFFNSLHHLPAAEMEPALNQAWRVLRPGGTLVVVEPVAAGDYFTLMRDIHDETEVRTQAQQALAAFAVAQGMAYHPQTYTSTVVQPSAEAVLAKLLRIDSSRAEGVESGRDTVTRLFSELGEPHPKGRLFLQPMVYGCFTKPA